MSFAVAGGIVWGDFNFDAVVGELRKVVSRGPTGHGGHMQEELRYYKRFMRVEKFGEVG